MRAKHAKLEPPCENVPCAITPMPIGRSKLTGCWWIRQRVTSPRQARCQHRLYWTSKPERIPRENRVLWLLDQLGLGQRTRYDLPGADQVSARSGARGDFLRTECGMVRIQSRSAGTALLQAGIIRFLGNRYPQSPQVSG